jgi:ribosomal protein L21E
MSSAIPSSNTTSSGRLRRSARAPKKSTAEYSVGDVVEVRQGINGCVERGMTRHDNAFE